MPDVLINVYYILYIQVELTEFQRSVEISCIFVSVLLLCRDTMTMSTIIEESI